MMSSSVVVGFFKDWFLPPMADFELGAVRTGTKKKEEGEKGRERTLPRPVLESGDGEET